MTNLALTIDIDWAPDWMIDEVAQILTEKRVKTTWFVTHASEAIERLRRQRELFEFGIHPNLLEGSEHGGSESEVLRHIVNIVPESESMRTHGLYQSTGFLKRAAEDYGIKTDVSIYLPGSQYIEPHRLIFEKAVLIRIPYFWEDDFEMFEQNSSWRLSDPKFKGPGLKVMNFHPVHVITNNPDYGSYRRLVSCCPTRKLNRDLVKKFKWNGWGPRRIFMDIVRELEGKGMLIKDIAKHEQRNNHT